MKMPSPIFNTINNFTFTFKIVCTVVNFALTLDIISLLQQISIYFDFKILTKPSIFYDVIKFKACTSSLELHNDP